MAGWSLDKMLAAHEGKLSVDAAANGRNCWHYLRCRLVAQLPFSSRMLEQCHSCPSLGMFCVLHAFSRLDLILSFSLSPLLILSLSCVILALERGISVFQANVLSITGVHHVLQA